MPMSSYRGNSSTSSPSQSNNPILVHVTGGGGGGSTPIGEVPSGAIDGVNAAFTLTRTPVAGSLLVQRNGVVLKPAVGYTLAGTTITFQAGYIPAVGAQLYANYAY